MVTQSRTAFIIANMDCPTEVGLIRNRLEVMPGVDSLSFDLVGRELSVSHHLDDEQLLLRELAVIGMQATIKPSPEEHEPVGRNKKRGMSMSTWVLLVLGGGSAIGAEVIAWSSGSETSPYVIAMSVASIVLCGRNTLRKAWFALRNFTLNIYFLMSIAVAGAMVIGEWPEAAVVIFLFEVAELIESLSLDRARNAIRGLMEMSPDSATVKTQDGGWIEVGAGQVEVGAIVRVKPGERIPLDGTVTAGQSSVNQAPITGENMPVEKSIGDHVFAGSVNDRGALDFVVTANRGNTTLARIIRSVQEAQSQRAPTQRFVDEFAKYYTPAVVIFAALVAAIPALVFNAQFYPWLYKALVLLVIACPCALVISTPVTVVSGLAAAARRGILVKGGAYLEEGRKIRAVALDKTGTLTRGKPVVTDVIPISDVPPERLLQIASSIETLSNHPVAGALAEASDGRAEALAVSEFQSLTGRGVMGVVDGERYHVGNHRLIEELGLCTPNIEIILNRLEEDGKTAVVLASSTRALAVFGVADTVRESSAEAVRELSTLGVVSVMLTGDNQTTAHAISRQVGINDVRGDMLPDDKLKAIQELRDKYGTVGMVGDGVNDAPALAMANVGFAMGAAGSDTALETADVALMNDDLRKLPEFLKLSTRTSRVLTQNISLSIGIKAVFFALALTGVATLWMAVFADMGASLIVVGNGLKLLRAT